MPGLFDRYDDNDNDKESSLHGGLFDRGSGKEREQQKKNREEDQFWDHLIDLDTLGFFDEDDE